MSARTSPRSRRRRAIDLTLVALFALSSCNTEAGLLSHNTKEKETALRLHATIGAYSREFDRSVRDASEKIIDTSPELKIRRSCTQWKLDSVMQVREISRLENKAQSLLGLWVYVGVMTYSFEKGGSRAEFGDAQPIAVKASKQLYDGIEQIARDNFEDSKDFDLAKTDVVAYIQEIGEKDVQEGQWNSRELDVAIRTFNRDANDRSWMPSLSLASVNPFSGLKESAAAVRYMTDKTSQLVEDLSIELPWRGELMLYDIEERQTIVSARESFAALSDSAVSFAATAAKLPDDTARVIKTSLAEIDARQEGLQLTLKQAEDTFAKADTVVTGLSQTAASLNEAGAAWDQTFRTLGLGKDPKEKPKEPAADEPKGRPFDILDYRDTAVELQRVAVELRGLVTDVKGLAGAPGEDAPLNDVEVAVRASVADATTQGRALVDHITLRAFQLLGAALVAAILYRVVATRLLPHKTPS